MDLWCPQEPKDGFKYPEIGIKDVCDPPCRCWGLNPSPLQEHQMFLISMPSLQLQSQFFSLNRRSFRKAELLQTIGSMLSESLHALWKNSISLPLNFHISNSNQGTVIDT